ncbi:hypothetical protein C8R42DRAFT_682891 [Lentinula raphanica]|nr:hypothetical protein C8R42DRAFT_682891 [Lentinula raphanica]
MYVSIQVITISLEVTTLHLWLAFMLFRLRLIFMFTRSFLAPTTFLLVLPTSPAAAPRSSFVTLLPASLLVTLFSAVLDMIITGRRPRAALSPGIRRALIMLFFLTGNSTALRIRGSRSSTVPCCSKVRLGTFRLSLLVSFLVGLSTTSLLLLPMTFTTVLLLLLFLVFPLFTSSSSSSRLRLWFWFWF